MLLPESASAFENAELVPREDNGGYCLDIAEGGCASWKITGEPGWYSVRINYYPGECRSSYASVSVKINGEIPFAEAGGISLSCIYADKDGIRQDYYGNDIRSPQSLAPRWETTYLYDTERYENSPLCFYLENTDLLSLCSVTGSFSVSLVELVPYSVIPDYADTIKEYSALGYTEISDSFDLYEAENYFLKSDPTVVPVSDSSSSVTPHDNFLMKLNTVSGSNWKTAGQFIIWKINVKQAGLYRITLKVKQDFREGLYSTRRLYINGEIPFAEADAVRFTYTGGWVNMTLGDGQNGDWLFYFEEGENEIKLEAVLGEMGGALREVSDIVDSLNTIYREILAVTGASPDSYRDYSLDKLVPEALEGISAQKKRLEEVRDSFEAVTGKKGGDLSVFDTLIKQLGSFEEDPDNIPPSFSYFKTNIDLSEDYTFQMYLGDSSLNGSDVYIDDICVYSGEETTDHYELLRSLGYSISAVAQPSRYSLPLSFEEQYNPFINVNNIYDNAEHISGEGIALVSGSEALNGIFSLKVGPIREGNQRTMLTNAAMKAATDFSKTDFSKITGIMLRIKISGYTGIASHRFTVALRQDGVAKATWLGYGAAAYDLGGNKIEITTENLGLSLPAGFDGFVFMPLEYARSEQITEPGYYDNYQTHPESMVDLSKDYSFQIYLNDETYNGTTVR